MLWRGARACSGVTAALALAVLAPRLGAPGGALHAEYLRGAALCVVHYAAGRRWQRAAGVTAPRPRLLALCTAHALLVSPALTAVLISCVDGVDYRIIKGVMVWSSGGGCAWLSVSLSTRGAVVLAAALVHVGSLLLTPLHTALFCGHASLPPALDVVYTLITSAAPFACGALISRRASSPPSTSPPPSSSPELTVQLAALTLLYSECCERICDAEAIVYLSDVLVAFALEAWCVVVSAAWCWVWWRGGVVSAADARLVALCAVPRHLDACGSALGCACSGMCRLPGVFVAPLQALLLTALTTFYQDHDDLSIQS